MKFFIDSSVIVESLKGTKKAVDMVVYLFEKADDVNLFINPTVFSETVYQLYYRRKFSLEEIKNFITKADILAEDRSVVETALALIVRYGLKPNDALILATCKRYGISYLISLDSDFEKACEREGVVLVDSSEKLREIFN